MKKIYKLSLFITIAFVLILFSNSCEDSFGLDENLKSTLVPHDTIVIRDTLREVIIQRDTIIDGYYILPDSISIYIEEFYIDKIDMPDTALIPTWGRNIAGHFFCALDTSKSNKSLSIKTKLKNNDYFNIDSLNSTIGELYFNIESALLNNKYALLNDSYFYLKTRINKNTFDDKKINAQDISSRVDITATQITQNTLKISLNSAIYFIITDTGNYKILLKVHFDIYFFLK